jgi:aminopeptidase
MKDLIADAQRHLCDILAIAFEHPPAGGAVVVYDSRSELSRILTEAYRTRLPSAVFLDFDAMAPESILSAFAPLRAGDLVVLVQSGNFRLEAFRLRVELFKRGLKVIEHPHLERMTGAEAGWYVDSLAYDPSYYRGVGGALRDRIDAAQSGIVDSGGERLVFSGPFEAAKLNVGDYRGMKNAGGQFPIGEVFTEARDLETVNGRVRIFIFADLDYMVNRPERPITLAVSRGRVVDAVDSTPDFEKVLAAIRADEGEVWVRELGFGMNRAFNGERVVRDIGTLERMCGIHLSLGAKHAIYNKPAFNRRHGRHHVDVFAITESVSLDGSEVFRGGGWIVQ